MEGLEHRILATNISITSSDQAARPTDPAPQVSRMIQTIGEKSTDLENFIKDQPNVRDFNDKQRKFIVSIIDLGRHDNLDFWLAVTYRVLYALSWKKGDGSVLLRLAELNVISDAQRGVAKVFWLYETLNKSSNQRYEAVSTKR